MTVQTINIGNVVNDGLGDDLRSAFQKVNANFAELNSALTVTVGSASTTGIDLFKEKINTQLIFKNLISGTKVLLNDTGNSIIVNNTAPDAFTRFETDHGEVLASTHQQIALQGVAAPGSTTATKDIEVTASVTASGSKINFKTVIPVVDILTSYDFGTLTGVYSNTLQFALSAANIDFGTISLPGRLDLDCGDIL